MMEAETASKTMELNAILTWLIAWEQFLARNKVRTPRIYFQQEEWSVWTKENQMWLSGQHFKYGFYGFFSNCKDLYG